MSLDDIRARAAIATEARLGIGEDDDEGRASIRAAFIAEQSSYDVPKLIMALDAVLAEHKPVTWTWAGIGPIQACETCSAESVTVEQAQYPCPTVRAITEAIEGSSA